MSTSLATFLSYSHLNRTTPVAGSLLAAPANALPPWTLATGLLMGGLVTIAGATALVMVISLRRLATRQWEGVDPHDASYAATFKRTFYRAARVKWQTYGVVAFYAVGALLLVASAMAKLLGA